MLLQAQDPDMTDMVVSARIDAPGDLDRERPDRLLPLGVGETFGDALRNRD